MKLPILLTILVSFIFAPLAFSNRVIPEDQLPPAVVQALDEYFPTSTVQRVEMDTDNGRTSYEIRIVYKEIRLEVDVSAEGKILDVDMD